MALFQRNWSAVQSGMESVEVFCNYAVNYFVANTCGLFHVRRRHHLGLAVSDGWFGLWYVEMLPVKLR